MNIELQVLGSALRAVAEEMGAVLVRSAFSANIKERRDCSTALFAEDGRMIAQAEHIPVHLGAMPEAVAAVRERSPEPGDVFVVNDPFTGGTHLPDVTLVSRTELGYAVSRAHYADVGGAEPAACPPARPTSTRRAWSFPRFASRTRSSPSSSPTCATRTSGGATSGRSWRPTGWPSGGSPSSASATAASASRRDGRAATRTRSAACARRSPRFPTAATRRPTSSRPPEGELVIRAR